MPGSSAGMRVSMSSVMSRVQGLVLVGLMLSISGCERDRQTADPFAVPGAMRMKVEYLTLPEAEARLKALPEGKTLAQVQDPCGQASGPDGASVAWVRAELVNRGHDPAMFCDILINPSAHVIRPRSDDTRTIEEIQADLAVSRTRLAMTNDNMLLTSQATEAALKIINRAPQPAAGG